MEVNFKHTAPGRPEPIYIEQVFAEVPGGGIVANPSFDVPPTTAVGVKDGHFTVIKAFVLLVAVTALDSTISIKKGSGIVVGDVIGVGKKAVACTKVDTSDPEKDVVTVTLGVEAAEGQVLYEAKEASENSAEPILKPLYITGNWLHANEGDQPVRLINGANVRKETANLASEVAALLPMITLV